MKVKGEISICTGFMLNDHSNPYVESTTVLSDYWGERERAPTCGPNSRAVPIDIIIIIIIYIAHTNNNIIIDADTERKKSKEKKD